MSKSINLGIVHSNSQNESLMKQAWIKGLYKQGNMYTYFSKLAVSRYDGCDNAMPNKEPFLYCSTLINCTKTAIIKIL